MPDEARDLVDFKKVKERVSITQILDHYKVELKREGDDSLVGCCPIHDGTNDRSFRASISKNAWKCFGRCDAGGNILDFVAAMEDVSVPKEKRKNPRPDGKPLIKRQRLNDWRH